jgi:hypothetical protein
MTRPRRSNTGVRAVAPLNPVFLSTTRQREGDGCSQVDYPTGVAITPGWGVRGPNDMKGKGSMRFKSRGVLAVLVAILAMSAIVATAAWASGSPFVETKPARSVSKTEALLNGVVNPNGAETKYHFEYGTTVSYGKSTAEVSVGSGTSNLEESKAVSGLTASTTYHFRIVATNSNGTSDGSDHTFTTASTESGCHIKAGSKKYGLCIEGAASPSAAIELNTVVGQPVELVTKELGLTILCQKISTTGELTGTESLTFKDRLRLSECSLEGSLKEKCGVLGTTEFNPTQGLFGSSSESFTVTPVSGEAFFQLVFTNKDGCPTTLYGTHPVTGQYECKLAESEAENVKHKETCEGEGLKVFGDRTSIIYWANVSLAEDNKGKKFSIYEH